MSLFALDLAELLPVFFGHSHLHLCQIPLFLVHGAAEHFLLSIHVIVSIEIDCLRTRCRIQQVLLHPFVIELLTLFLGQLVIVHSKLKLLICADYARLLRASCLLSRRLANHPLTLFTPIVTFCISNSLVNQVRYEKGAQGKQADQGNLFIVLK